MNLDNTTKLLLGALGTILLGALGSGFWERILSPALNYLSSTLITTFSAISSSYSDAIYSSAAQLLPYYSTEHLGFLITLLVISWLFFVAIRSKKDNLIIGVLHRAIQISCGGWVGVVLFGAMFISTLFSLARLSAVDYIRSYSHQNMEIVRPYIGERKYIQLRSKYSQIRTRGDFDKFLADLYEAAQSENIVIQQFNPIVK